MRMTTKRAKSTTAGVNVLKRGSFIKNETDKILLAHRSGLIRRNSSQILEGSQDDSCSDEERSEGTFDSKNINHKLLRRKKRNDLLAAERVRAMGREGRGYV